MEDIVFVFAEFLCRRNSSESKWFLYHQTFAKQHFEF